MAKWEPEQNVEVEWDDKEMSISILVDQDCDDDMHVSVWNETVIEIV